MDNANLIDMNTLCAFLIPFAFRFEDYQNK